MNHTCHCDNSACMAPDLGQALLDNSQRPDLLAGIVTAAELLARIYCTADDKCLNHITPDPRHRDNLSSSWTCREHDSEVPC